MAAGNQDVKRRPRVADIDDGWEDSSEDEDDGDGDIYTERETLRIDRALMQDIDDKVQYWVNCIQSRVPGAAILPIATFDDHFDSKDNGGPKESRRRCGQMKERLLYHERRKVEDLEERLRLLKSSHRANSEEASRMMHLLSQFYRPKLIFDNEGDPDSILRVSGKDLRGFSKLRKKIIGIATGRDLPCAMKYPVFRGHIGSPIPPIRMRIREFIRVKKAEKRIQVLEWNYFLTMLEEVLGSKVDIDQVSDALQFCHAIGELSYFGGQVSAYILALLA